MKKKIHTIDEYRQISADVWLIFRRYFPNGADLTDFTKDVDALEKKYKPDVRQYCFFQELMRVYFHELNELKGVQIGKETS
ncbi:MAG: hypothetical protein IIY21_04040 [Clostridiales bacterium]|nr:hypothetical protein [Clostridiales bacterium]MBQ1575127.1 hypothetical protein [Clostridiales bacterium]